tara:strand:- start:827 stop:1483 length:657 start_codon:yes stop_codon:yes gene_type:complete
MIKLENLTVRAGGFRIENISFEIPTGSYGVLMGRTGSGKTTILEAICGLKQVLSGSICLMDREVTRKPPGERGIGFVPQDGSLFTTKTIRKHLAFGPTVHGWKSGDIVERVEELADDLGISHLLDRKPHGLSGGERQRVALGRALAVRPGVLCLDEPLSALDEETHGELIDLLKKVTVEHQVTVLHITHSPREAEQVGDLLFRIEEGKVIEVRANPVG